MKSPSASPEFSIREFLARFPTDEACLAHIMDVRFGGTVFSCSKCGVVDSSFHRLSGVRAYSCASCGHHVHPTAGTILEDTRTPLTSWFYAMYLFATTRHGVSGKELQRQLGVTYKTAWRIGMQIRKLTCKTEFHRLLEGHIEMDEAYVGGRVHGGKRGRGAENKTAIFGMIERDGGPTRVVVVPDTSTESLKPHILENVAPGSTISTDEHRGYALLKGAGYQHFTVNHSAKEYADWDEDTSTLVHTNTVEGFWRLFKAAIRSTHVHISEKYMQRYLDEFTFRATHRARVNGMFDLLVGAL